MLQENLMLSKWDHFSQRDSSKYIFLSTYVYILCRLLHPLCWDPEEGGTGKTQDVLTYSPVELQTTVEQLFQQ